MTSPPPTTAAPNRRRKILVWVAVAVIAWIAIALAADDQAPGSAAPASAPTAQAVASPTKPELNSNFTVDTFSLKRDDDGMLAIVGTLRNKTSRKYPYVQVEFNLYDQGGTQVGSTMANVNNLDPSGTWRFEAPVLERGVTRVELKGITSY